MFLPCLQSLPVTARGTPHTLETQTPGTPWVSRLWTRQPYLYWKPITLVDEDHINDYQNHSTVYLNFKDVEVWLSLTLLSITKEDSSTTRRADPPWITQTASSSPPPPWEPPVDSWDGPQRNVSNLSAIGQDWALPGKKSERTFSHTAQQIFFYLTH